MDEFVVRFAYKQAVRRHQSYVTHQLLSTRFDKRLPSNVRRRRSGDRDDPLEKRLVKLTRRPRSMARPV